MDGNFRWGCGRGGDWRRGHEEGVNALRRVINFCREDGVKALTVYAFSTENWDRSHDEVTFLMRLIERTLSMQLAELHDQGVRLTFAGDREALPEQLRRVIDRAEQTTAGNTDLVLCVCLSYGARQDITHAAQQLCKDVQEGKLTPEQTLSNGPPWHYRQITEQLLSDRLSTQIAMSTVGNPDLLIRTSGEQRLSNFLLWEIAYTELYFTQACWPDFDAHEWANAMQHFASRQRRYGRRTRAPNGDTARAIAEDTVKRAS